MLDILVPVFNEADNILLLFDEIQKEIQSEKRVYVIYDFDEDNTVPVVKENSKNYLFPIKAVRNNIGRGVLNAIKVGIQNSESDMILVMMADLSDRLDVVDQMVDMMQQGYDIVCGSRYMKGGKQNGGPFLKTLFSKTAGLSLHFLTSIPTHDVTNSFKLYSKQLLNRITMESTGGFEIGLEITVKAFVGGYRIGEVPSEWCDRENGESNFHMWKWMPKYLKWYLYCIMNTWFRSQRNTKVQYMGNRKAKKIEIPSDSMKMQKSTDYERGSRHGLDSIKGTSPSTNDEALASTPECNRSGKPIQYQPKNSNRVMKPVRWDSSQSGESMSTPQTQSKEA